MLAFRPRLLAFMVVASGASAQAPARLSSAEFGALVERLSEPGGYFDTDNLVSNEDSYLHAVTGLERHGVRGGAYLGVGPDQNFSYIAAIKPRIAFIIDVRRDNLLEQLLFKALFHRARNRVEFLSLLFGKASPPDSAGWGARDLEAILTYVSRGPPDSAGATNAGRVVGSEVRRFGIPLSAQDLAAIGRFHQTFVTQGPELKLTTFGRPERYDYPTYRRLLLESDLSGRRANYLTRESEFQFVKALQERNLVVPVVGDLAGPKAVTAIARYLAEHDLRVAAFYTSNVEQYLFQDGTFAQFARNLEALPHDERSVIIRSYFPYGRPHPQAIPGYLSVQLLQAFNAFRETARTGGFRSYRDLVTRDLLPPR